MTNKGLAIWMATALAAVHFGLVSSASAATEMGKLKKMENSRCGDDFDYSKCERSVSGMDAECCEARGLHASEPKAGSKKSAKGSKKSKSPLDGKKGAAVGSSAKKAPVLAYTEGQGDVVEAECQNAPVKPRGEPPVRPAAAAELPCDRNRKTGHVYTAVEIQHYITQYDNYSNGCEQAAALKDCSEYDDESKARCQKYKDFATAHCRNDPGKWRRGRDSCKYALEKREYDENLAKYEFQLAEFEKKCGKVSR